MCALKADTRFIWDVAMDEFHEVLGPSRSEEGITYFVAFRDRSLIMVATGPYPLVGLAEVARARVRGAKVYLSNPSVLAHAHMRGMPRGC